MNISSFIATGKNIATKFIYVLLHLPFYIKHAFRILYVFSSFFAVLFLFMLAKAASLIFYIPLLNRLAYRFLPKWEASGKRLYNRAIDLFESMRPFKIKRVYLVHIAYENLKIRKSRSFITILGMSVGVGIIVYLLALGYGIEKLVIRQVASLNELKIIDVTSGENGRTTLNSEVLKRIQKIKGVDKIIPYISIAGRMNYKNANLDVVVYAVPSNYFETIRPPLLRGAYFAKKADEPNIFALAGQVAGVHEETRAGFLGEPISDSIVHFSVRPDRTAGVWKSCTMKSELLGETIRTEGGAYQGTEVWGAEYAPFYPFGRGGFDQKQHLYLGVWLKGDFALYKSTEKGELTPLVDAAGQQVWQQGCVQRDDVQITEQFEFIDSSVLGEATQSAELIISPNSATLESSEGAVLASSFQDSEVSTNAAGLEVVHLKKEQGAEKKEERMSFTKAVSQEAIMSSGLASLLNAQNPTKESFKVSFILMKNLLPAAKGRVLTEEATYYVKGVVEDQQQQFIFIPLRDLTNLGVKNFSQLKVVLNDTAQMAKIRKEIETMGYKTASTADTVTQIERFFANLRGVLGILGFIALAVASLGMFNTLTVSLLERTREIGGMKTMGMVSGEIQELFLAEAMIMGFAGGLGGLLLGFVVGKLSSYLISIVAIAQGVGYLELTYVPPGLILFIIISSFIVGVVTGLYPSYRAKKISALNALRYE